MTESEAQAELERRVAPDIEPTLSDAAITALLAGARRPDTEARVWSDDDWEPTWDLDAAACAGWEQKAAIAAAQFSFSEDGQSFSRKQVFDACLAMAKLYRRGSGSVQVHSVIDHITPRTGALPGN